jgi:hypothetical protein
VVVRHGALVRLSAVEQPGEAVVRVMGRKYAHVVPLIEELLGQGFDVPTHSPRIRRRIRGDQCDAHEA